MCRNFLNFFLFFLLIHFSLVAQNIRINEVVSSNSEHYDEDGDTPDWIELYNFGITPVSLFNWGLTDDADNLHSWQFPDITLNPDEYLLVWASDKDRNVVSFSRTLVNIGDVHKYIVPTHELENNWRVIDFDDSTWRSGASGFGFGDGDDETIVSKGQNSVFTRVKFTIEDLDNLKSLILDVDYDDSFVAYINGYEVARANVNGSPPVFDATAFTGHEAQIYKGGRPERFIVDNPLTVLVNGENVLAIQVHNRSKTSSDLTLIPFLSAIFSNSSSLGVKPPEILNIVNANFHTNFKVSSESEEIFLSDENQNIIDHISIKGLKPNTSFGISTETNNGTFYKETTPGAINSLNEFAGVVKEEVVFSNQGGIIESSFINLSLSGNTSSQEIRYTLDATQPTMSSKLYNKPIQINENTVVRAKIFEANFISSFSQTKTYIFNSDHKIDVVFLSTEPDNFFDNDNGIYVYGDDFESNIPYKGANFWEDWERPIHFSFYNKDTKKVEVEFNAGVKIFGGRSRIRDQRPFSIFVRGKYGTSEIEYPFFETLDYDKFQSLIIRNSGNDWLRTSIKDATLTSLMEGSGLDIQAFNPIATYLNGEYWGLYNLREKISEHFLASKHDLDIDDINLLERNAQVKHGSSIAYNLLIDYVSSTDLTSNANFEYVKERVDLNNYAVYQATQIYIGNVDWPGNNIRFWNHTEGKWRWILYDTDLGFGSVNRNGMSHATGSGEVNRFNPTWSTLLFRRLLTNTDFKNKFINRYADELNTRFLPETIKNRLDEVFEMVISEIPSHYTRWEANPANAQTNINRMKTFADNRPNIAKKHILQEFDIDNYHELTITNSDTSKGFVELNRNLKIKETLWKGDYFETVPVTLTAIPEKGYEFSHWSGASSSTEKEITINLTDASIITPNFVTSSLVSIVINEINYNSGDKVDSSDWIELYNPNDLSIDMSNWALNDSKDDNVFVFPEKTVIEGRGYLVLVRNEEDFNSVFPLITNYIGEFNFGLGGNDSVRLFDNNEVLQDQVDYNSDLDWASCADGKGPTLELISPDLDNTIATSWDCTNTFGTPDQSNSIPLSLDDLSSENFIIYPNPMGVNKKLFIKGNEVYKVEIYSILGKKVFDKNIPNKRGVELNLTNLASGVYILNINKKYRSKLIVK